MARFLSETERQAVLDAVGAGNALIGRFWAALRGRVRRRMASPGLTEGGQDAAWWYPAAEYLSDAAMAYALEPTPALAGWLREVALAIARRPESDWVGPWYRDHVTQPAVGHLETAHLVWAVGTALDLAPDAFTAGEREELRRTLQDKGLTLCRRWLDRNQHLANWRAVMVAGVAVAAAVTEDRSSLEQAARETRLCSEAFQPDGSYAESLQYANYLAYALMIAFEAIHRTAPELEPAGPDIVARSMPWIAGSMLYSSPLAGWGAESRARAVNFNDCGATFRPSGDVLLQVAARCRDSQPIEASLARWLFDEYYVPVPAQRPHHLATFGLRNDWGFLTLPFLVRAAPVLSPTETGLPAVAGYSNGNVFARDYWNGRTVLAVQTGTGPLYGPGHLHGDLNSFLLVHNRQRLLVDPGHSCYRNLIHGLESSSQTHNTCTFLVAQDELGLQEDLAKAVLLQQSNVAVRRRIEHQQASPPVPPRGRRLLLQHVGGVTAIGSEAASLYGAPIREFARYWLLASSRVLFVIDRIVADRPVTTIWNWLLNNQGGGSEIETLSLQSIGIRRGLAGLKLWHLGDGRQNGPVYAYVHDAYHPEPDRPGEGRPGSGMLYRWIEPQPRATRLVVHAIALDDYGRIDRWQVDGGPGCWTLANGECGFSLETASEQPLRLILRSRAEPLAWRLEELGGEIRFLIHHGE
jgi:hypothetical protein